MSTSPTKAAAAPAENEPLAARVYRACCAARDVKPNAGILDQILISHALDLKDLDCSRTFLGANGVHALLDFATMHQGLRTLDLTNNGITTQAIGHLTSLLATHQSLEVVTLCSNELSTPAARQLWDVTRQCRRLREIVLDETRLAEEWTMRIARQLAANRELFDLGFTHDPLSRSEHQWVTISAFVVAAPGMVKYAELFDQRVIPALNEAVAGWRVRVVGAVHCEPNPVDNSQLEAHMRLAQDPNAANLTWVVSFLGEELPSAWRDFFNKYVLPMRRPVPPPLRNKIGDMRDPVRLVPFTSFCYVGRIPERDVLDLTDEEKARNEVFAALRASDATLCSNITSEDAVHLRLVTDIFNSIRILYNTSGPFSRTRTVPTSAAESMSPAADIPDSAIDHRAAMNSMAGRMKELTALVTLPAAARPAELDNVLRYCLRPVAGAAFPFILYGSPGSGRGTVMNHATQALMRDVGQTHIIAPFTATEVQSAVQLLLFLLHFFSDEPEVLGCGLHDGVHFAHLQRKVRQAIMAYPAKAKPIVVLVKNADLLDNVWSPGLVPTQWLPFSFPENVRIVLSMATESNFLHVMRSREQQPFDLLVRPLAGNHFAAYLRSLLNERNAPKMPGLGPEAEDIEHLVTAATGVIKRPRSVATALFLKQDSDMALYAQASCSLLRIAHVKNPDDFASEESLITVVHSVDRFPHTCEAAFELVLVHMDELYSEKLVRDALLGVCAASCSLPELVAFVENDMENERFSALSVITHLQDMNILLVTPSGAVRTTHHIVGRVIAARYEQGAIDEYRAAWAVHFAAIVVERGHGFASAFARAVDLFLHVGDIDGIVKFLFDVELLDRLVHETPESRPVIYEAFWKTIHHVEHLRDIQFEGFATVQFRTCETLLHLKRAVRCFTQTSPKVWQSALAMPFDSPLYMATHRVTVAPYPSARRVNRPFVETYSVFHAMADAKGLIHCSLDGSVAAITGASGSVFVVDVHARQIVATRPLSSEVTATTLPPYGAHVLGLDVVLIVHPDRVVRWEWRTGKTRTLLGYTASLRSTAIRGDEEAFVAVQLSESGDHQVVVLDATHGKELSVIPHELEGEAVREAHFVGGEHVLIVGHYAMQLVRSDGTGARMQVPSGAACIHTVASSRDTAWIAACAGAGVYLFGRTGDVLHEVRFEADTAVEVAFHPNGSLLAVATAAGNIDVRLTLSGQQKRLLETSIGAADYLTFTPDGTKLIARCRTGLRMFDGTTLEDLGAIAAHDGWIRFMCVTNTTYITVGEAGVVKLWDSARAFPSVTAMATNSEDTTDLLRSSLVSSKSPIAQVVVRRDVAQAAVRTEHGDLSLWDLTKAGNLNAAMPRTALFNDVHGDVAYREDGAILAFRRPRKLCVLATTSNALLEPSSIDLPGDVETPTTWKLVVGEHNNHEVVACCAVYPNGVRILVYDSMTLKLVVQFVGHAKPIAAAVIAHDAVITASEDGRVIVWSLLSKAERTSFTHSRPLIAINVGANRKFLLADDEGSLFELALAGYDFVASTPCRIPVPAAMVPITRSLYALADRSKHLAFFDVQRRLVLNRIATYGDIRCVAVAKNASRHFAFFGSGEGSVEVFHLQGV